MRRSGICVKQAYIILFFMIFSLPALYSVSYDEAKTFYNNKDYSRALDAFLSFAAEFPESPEWDNALYYAGRIELKNGNTEVSEKYFLAVADRGKGSHYNLSLLNLSRIYNRREDYKKVPELLSSLEDIKAVKKNNLLLASELSESHYQLGRIYRSEDNNSMALDSFISAQDFTLHLEKNGNPDDKLDILIRLARINKHIFYIYRDEDDLQSAEKYRISGLEIIKAAELLDTENERQKTISLIFKALNDPQSSEKESPINMEGKLFAGAGIAFFSDLYGGELEGEIEVSADLNDDNRLIFKAGYIYDSFSKKTFNFPDTTIDNVDRRLYQYTNSFDADLSWRYGSFSDLYSKMTFGSSFQTAEENEDNSMSLDLSESIYYRMSDFTRPGLKFKLQYTEFPNYLSSGRKLDSLSIQTSPNIRFYLSDSIYFNIEYSYKLKQYLDAKYDSSDPAVSDSDNRRYHIHSADLALKADISKNWDSKLSYITEYLTADNYDLWVSFKNPDSQIFVENYFENIEHKVSWKNDFIYRESVSIDIDSFFAYQKYFNYPARSSAGEDKDELRSDLNFGIELSAEIKLDERWSVVLNTIWETNISNTDYDNSYSTNYDWLTAVAGISYSF